MAGWKAVGGRVKEQIRKDHVPLLAAGLAFYAMLGLFPALIALVTIYGLVADPAQVQRQIEALTSAVGTAGEVIGGQMDAIVQTSPTALGWGLVASLAGVLWSASSGMQGLIKATNVAYDEPETRGFLRLRGLALLLSLGAILFMAFAIGLVAIVPPLLDQLGFGAIGRFMAQVARWVLLALGMVVGLGVVYRYAPDRDEPKWRWVNPGAVIGTALWLIASALFSLYISNFGSYNETYGALGGVIVLLLWLFLTSFVVLLGAEINAEAELQTLEDTTTGEPEPRGERGAVKADRAPEAHG